MHGPSRAGPPRREAIYASPDEQRTVLAALVEGAAYGARCAHSDRLTDFGRHAPLPDKLWPPRNDSAADFLEAHAQQLLAR
jgi:hypothetical protein